MESPDPSSAGTDATRADAVGVRRLLGSSSGRVGLWAVALVAVTAWATWPLIGGSDPDQATGTPGVRVRPSEVYNPVLAGEPLPDGFRQVLPRDAILPVYEPVFVPAAESEWDLDADVIGVEIDGEARAYPVSLLNGREMVIDEIAGVPIVVTW